MATDSPSDLGAEDMVDELDEDEEEGMLEDSVEDGIIAS
jgi:hypothetical protein